MYFFLNKYNLLNTRLNKNKIGISIFHIDKKQHKQNKQILKLLKLNSYVKAIQVTNQKLKKYLLKNGVSKKNISDTYWNRYRKIFFYKY